MSAPAPPPPGATAGRGGPVTVAGVLAIAVNVGFALLGVIGAVITGLIASGEPRDDHHVSNDPAVWGFWVFVIVLVLAVIGIVMGRSVLLRRARGRWVTVAMFSVYGLIAGTFLVVGALDPTIGVGSALVTGGLPLVFCVAIVSLLLTPRASDEFAAPVDAGGPEEVDRP